jgi:glycosyltransferase involved in cell wall biosynthesis
VVAIILTLDEADHLARCLTSLQGVVDECYVVDSFSSDDTVSIAAAHGARVLQREWVNHAVQFNWALDQLDPAPDWVLRIDADEYVTPELANEIRTRLPDLGPDVEGVICNLRRTFQGRMIRFGGLAEVGMLRLFRYGRGRCEHRWMDEHVSVAGRTVRFRASLVDDSLRSLTSWTKKHNDYASREAVELLDLEYGFLSRDRAVARFDLSETARKRWLKDVVYARLPRGFRALLYFLYRYVVLLGFMDGRAGTTFHVLQGFWYRYLVDAKVAEVKRCMREADVDVETAIGRVLGVRGLNNRSSVHRGVGSTP